MTAAAKVGTAQRHPLAAGLLATLLTGATLALAAAGPSAPGGVDGVAATSRARTGGASTLTSPTCSAPTVGPVSMAASRQAAPLAWPCAGLPTG